MPSQSFSDSIDNVLDYLRPYGRECSSYPRLPSAADLKQAAKESVRDWFLRLVRTFCDGDPKRCAIEDNIAIFISLYWNGDLLIGCNISVFVTDTDLENLAQETDFRSDIFYLRLDFDPNSLGQPFTHPLPHIHVTGNPSPRFSLDGGTSGNVVMDFIEFIYRQHAPRKWLEWLKREWNKNYRDDPIDRVLLAFENQEDGMNYLRENTNHINRLKTLLQRRKDELFGFFMDTSDRALLAYP